MYEYITIDTALWYYENYGFVFICDGDDLCVTGEVE